MRRNETNQLNTSHQSGLAAGTFWFTPAQTRQGPHQAMTEVELLTVRLGAMGEFEGDGVS